MPEFSMVGGYMKNHCQNLGGGGWRLSGITKTTKLSKLGEWVLAWDNVAGYICSHFVHVYEKEHKP